MWPRLRPWLPEIALVLVGAFFILRDLGTFPAAWADDSLFMIIAKRLATGHGYSLPVLGESWEYPFIIGVGPTVLVPSAIAIKLLGFSVAAARVPMTIYLSAAALLMYIYTNHFIGRRDARWAAALLITLSAFVNTGKPVLGEIPAFVFLIAGLLLFDRIAESWKWGAAVGAFFGLAVISKVSFGMVFPAIGVAWVWMTMHREWDDVRDLTIVGAVALGVFLILSPTLGMGLGLLRDMQEYGIAGGGQVLNVLRAQPELLLRLPYLYFGTLFVLAIIGARHNRFDIAPAHGIFLWSFVLFNIFFFLNEHGWFRHLLPAHLLLLPFVASGAYRLLGKRFAEPMLLFFVLAQSWWQLTYMGSRWIREGELAAAEIQERFVEMPIVIEQPEVYVRLPENPRWLFLSDELKTRDYVGFENLPKLQNQHCMAVLRKVGEPGVREYGNRMKQVYGRYYLLLPEENCVPTEQDIGART